jgi:hypothetical protein
VASPDKLPILPARAVKVKNLGILLAPPAEGKMVPSRPAAKLGLPADESFISPAVHSHPPERTSIPDLSICHEKDAT